MHNDIDIVSRFPYKPGPLYCTVHYNMVLDITMIIFGPQMVFYILVLYFLSVLSKIVIIPLTGGIPRSWIADTLSLRYG